MDQTGSKRRSELSPSGICCQLPPLAALQTARIQVAACWGSQDSAQRRELKDWDQRTDSLRDEERVALNSVLCCVKWLSGRVYISVGGRGVGGQADYRGF